MPIEEAEKLVEEKIQRSKHKKIGWKDELVQGPFRKTPSEQGSGDLKGIIITEEKRRSGQYGKLPKIAEEEEPKPEDQNGSFTQE